MVILGNPLLHIQGARLFSIFHEMSLFVNET
jgi:hypothetical protein